MPQRKYSAGDSYRYGYGGMEKDNETSGEGNSYTTEFRQYDPRLGRWFSQDPLFADFPWQSPYVAFDNNPIYYSDPTGLQGEPPKDQKVIKAPNGTYMNIPATATVSIFQTTSGKVNEGKTDITMTAGSAASFRIGNDRYVATFDKVTGAFAGYGLDKNMDKLYTPDNIIYQSKITPEFKGKLLEVSYNLNHDPNKLMAVFAQETGEKFKANTKSSDGQVGLIQFTQAAIDQINKDFNTSYTKAKLEAMTEVEQLGVVQQYFQTAMLKNKTIVKIEDYAVATFSPANTGKENSHVLYSKKENRYKKNKGLDTNKDGKITVGEVGAKYAKKYKVQ